MTDNDALPENDDDLTELGITQLAHQSLFIDQLLEQIKLAQHHRFGVKSEPQAVAVPAKRSKLILPQFNGFITQL